MIDNTPKSRRIKEIVYAWLRIHGPTSSRQVESILINSGINVVAGDNWQRHAKQVARSRKRRGVNHAEWEWYIPKA